MATTTYCSGCLREEPFDKNWLALWIDSEARLVISRQERDFERPEAVFACGQGSALALTECYLHHGSFQHAPDVLGGVDPDFHNEAFHELT